jgi:hypothetical protein
VARGQGQFSIHTSALTGEGISDLRGEILEHGAASLGVQVERGFYLLTSGMLLDLYRTPRPLEAITDVGTNPNAVPLEKFIIEGEESSDSGSAQLFPFFPNQNLQWCWVCRPRIKSAASLFCDASVLFHLRL